MTYLSKFCDNHLLQVHLYRNIIWYLKKHLFAVKNPFWSTLKTLYRFESYFAHYFKFVFLSIQKKETGLAKSESDLKIEASVQNLYFL